MQTIPAYNTSVYENNDDTAKSGETINFYYRSDVLQKNRSSKTKRYRFHRLFIHCLKFLYWCVPESMDSDRKISTFAFLDLEGTGTQIRPHITEIAVVAIHRSTIETKAEKLRVSDKLVTCVHPMKPVSVGATWHTGLDNYNLEYQKEFDNSLVDMLHLFIKRHVPPVCIVAHNGKGYDFGLLKTELKRIDRSLPENLLCIDSLDYFRALDGLYPIYELVNACKKKIGIAHGRDTERCGTTPLTRRSLVSRDGESVKRKLFPVDEQEYSSPKKRKCSLMRPSKQQMKERKQSKSHAAFTDFCVQPDYMMSDSDSFSYLKFVSKASHYTDAVEKLEEEIMKERLESSSFSSLPQSSIRTRQEISENSGQNGTNADQCRESLRNADALFDSRNKELSDSQLLMHIQCLEEQNCQKDKVKTELVTSDSGINNQSCLETPSKLVQNPKQNASVIKGRNSQREIYKRLTGEYPDHEHRAEDDCMALAEIFRMSSPEILIWCDKNAVLFSNIPIRYEPKPIRQLPPDVFPFQS